MQDSLQTGQPKRLALFLDGTWNIVSDNTNVWRMRTLCALVGRDGREQRIYYSTGLGTKVGEKVRGGMFGRGIDTAITDAYEWLVDNYSPDDEIFIFGFSRGAYTARSLSGFISKSGLLVRGAPLGVNQLFKRYRTAGAKTIRDLLSEKEKGRTDFDREEAWMLRFARAISIKFIGVYDTVGSLGVPFALIRRIRGTAYPFLNTGLRQSNEYAFHALAIDEHRKDFRPTLWSNQGATNARPRPIERTEQRWFVGAHANVGGGYFSDPLAQIPFKWLEKKATLLGLTFDDGFPADEHAERGAVADSYATFLYGWYRVLKLWVRYYRPIGEPPKDEGAGVTNINETIDGSVFNRWRADEKYRPPGLVTWGKAKGVDPKDVMGTVRADNPATQVAD